MGNSKTRQNGKNSPIPEGYSFYSSTSSEQRVYITISKSTINLASGQGNPVILIQPFKNIKIDKDFKILSEVSDRRCIIIEYNTLKGKCSCILRMETVQDYQMWTSFLKSLKRPKWDESTSLFCKICAKEFNFFRRQHHCRKCGIVVCKSHARNKVWLHELGYDTKERICNTCFGNKTFA
ncbi:hypothetical protein SteCoe_25253 [Stentor coeruleus]|uniref:FYVE-type domain-containing protein n=1 Tax=Stentor coeruleus TaxID=5963 RepID=A0A1R2BFP3_9CILI|nr:hypothetical protein SteCoe_25253 [Stentor coeruleus]